MSETKRDLQTEIYPRMFERAGDAFYWLQLTRRGNVWEGPVKLDGSAPRRPRHDKVRLDGDHIGQILEQGGGTVSYWDCVAVYEGIDPNDKPAMMQRLKEMAGLATDGPVTTSRPRKVEPRQQVEPAPPGFYDDVYSALLDLGQDVETMPADAPGNLITKRGIDPETLRTWRVRYYPPDRRRAILQNMQERFPQERLTGAGIHAGFNFCRYVFPFLGQGGRVLTVQGGRDPGDPYGKYIHPGNEKARSAGIPYVEPGALYGGQVLGSLDPGATVHVFEGLTDTLTAASLGLPAVGLAGVNGLTERNEAAIMADLQPFRVCFTRDNDPAGQDLERRIIEAARRHGVDLGPCLHVPEGHKDLNDYWQGVLNDGQRRTEKERT